MSNSKQIRVLHVEDEVMDSELTKLFLKKKGYDNLELTSVLSAEEALKKLPVEDFDVIVSDYKMPGMNGLEFLEELRRRGNNIPFIIFTGKGEEKVAIDALNKGANRYIKKDEKPSVLFDTLARCIKEVVEEGVKRREKEKRVKELEVRGISASKELEEEARRQYIDRDSFTREYMDLIILGVLIDKEAPMSGSDLIEEIDRRFGIRVNVETLRILLDELEEKGVIELRFSEELRSFVVGLEEGMEGLFKGPTISREVLTKFLCLVEGFKGLGGH